MSCIFPCRHCGRLGTGNGIPEYPSDEDEATYPDSLFITIADHIHVPLNIASCIICKSPVVIVVDEVGPPLTESPHLARPEGFSVTCALDERHCVCHGTKQDKTKFQEIYTYIATWLRGHDLIVFESKVVPLTRHIPAIPPESTERRYFRNCAGDMSDTAAPW
jgi:hypothetical protein